MELSSPLHLVTTVSESVTEALSFVTWTREARVQDFQPHSTSNDIRIYTNGYRNLFVKLALLDMWYLGTT